MAQPRTVGVTHVRVPLRARHDHAHGRILGSGILCQKHRREVWGLSKRITTPNSTHVVARLLGFSGREALACAARPSSASNTGVDSKTVRIFWDLDNICPKASEAQADVRRLRIAVSEFGDPKLRAFANRRSMTGFKEWDLVLAEEDEKALHASKLSSEDPAQGQTGQNNSLESPIPPSLQAQVAGFTPRERNTNTNPKKRKKQKRAKTSRPPPKEPRASERVDQHNRFARELAASQQPERELQLDGIDITVVPTVSQAADRALRREVRATVEEAWLAGGAAAVGSMYVCVVSNDTGLEQLVKEIRRRGAKPLVISNNRELQALGVASS
eukprot:CAMPEP_0118955180 /NCGR_PEP_ID=MMETSP1169-20130426/59583_1 /TAXON_ID=36882 /ORGANISM="Pyramimonas obovata, Strain CCMP722" /LENGTH=328 /DNA_ID=CAMNT_0006902973 /DNA_START=306 /DNA_END=1288 /DNA_ORIENTATION=+